MKLLEYREISEWLELVRATNTGSERTIRSYTDYITEFFRWAQQTPTEIIQESVAQFKPGARSIGETKTLKFFNYLVSEKGYKRTTATTRYGTVRSFFRANNILFIAKTPNCTPEHRTHAPPKTELMRMWSLLGLEDKVVIGIFNDTGMRPEDAVELVYLDIVDSIKLNEPRLYIEKTSQKEDLAFAVCLSIATTAVVKQYLQNRRDAGEVITNSTPIITRAHEPGRKIGPNAVYRKVVAAGAVAGIKLNPKMFRERFRTYGSPIVGNDAIQKMGAWKIPGAGKHYFLPPREETIKTYAVLEPTLTLEESRAKDAVAQRIMAAEMLKAAGLDPDKLLAAAKAERQLTTEEEAGLLLQKLISALRGEATKAVKEEMQNEIHA